MRERDLARAGNAAPARETGRRNGVVRRAERTGADQGDAGRQRTRDRVDLRRLDGLLERHLGQDGRDPAREHALAGARRADQQYIM